MRKSIGLVLVLAAAVPVLAGQGAALTDLGLATVAVASPAAAAPSLPAVVRHDFDGDGKPDILWRQTATNRLRLWSMDGLARLSETNLQPPSLPDRLWRIRASGDLNGDGSVDLLLQHNQTGELRVWLMQGTTRLAEATPTPSLKTGIEWRVAGLADFNQDGKLDILWHHQKTGEVFVWFLDGIVRTAESFLTPSAFTDTRWQVRGLADFDGDGKSDILWHHQATGDLYVWFLDGTAVTHGSYVIPSRYAEADWDIVQVADFTADGMNDLLWRNRATGALKVWVMDHAVRTAEAPLSPSAEPDVTWRVETQGSVSEDPPLPFDFNGDGKSDVLWHHQGQGWLYSWLLDGTVTTAGSYLSPDRFADTLWQIRGISDFNLDGKNDILWHHQGRGDLYVWFMGETNGVVATGGEYLSPRQFADTRWQIRGIADFNGDGHNDILWHHQGDGWLYVWFMKGLTATDGSYLTPPAFTDTRWVIRGVADFNGDGKSDILWHHQGDGRLYAWFLGGTNGVVTVGGSYLTPMAFTDTQWKIVQVADFNADGKSDILWHHQGDGRLYAWFLGGTNGVVTVDGGYLTPAAFTDTQWKIVPR